METTTALRPYPVGLQTFSELREGNYVYVDKTALVYRMTHGAKYQFLSRPRRFGKSLLISTLHSYFEGRRELFKGLAIDALETEWTAYPVIRIDMSAVKHSTQAGLESNLNSQLFRYESIYGKNEADTTLNDRLKGLIENAYAKTGRKVVVLIDEYDAPLLNVVHQEEELDKLRQVMRNFYSPLKACDPYLHFVFLTGITKFSQLSIFSELNNIENISMDEQYATLCGISKEELLSQLKPDIQALAKKVKLGYKATCDKLRDYYDGYHFTWPSRDVYNPYSLLMAMHKGKIAAYWFDSGTPTYLIEMLRKHDVVPSQIGGVYADTTEFDAPTEQMTDVIPLFYQSGYLTIKNYDKASDTYLLDIPNNEVRLGLMQSLIPDYVTPNPRATKVALHDFARLIYHDDMDGLLRQLQTFLGTVPHCNVTNHEGHYQQMLYVILSLLGKYCDVEVHTALGRIDMVMRTARTLYLFELKVGGSAQAAMDQIDIKQYARRFALCRLPVVKVAAVFDTATRTLADGWLIQPA